MGAAAGAVGAAGTALATGGWKIAFDWAVPYSNPWADGPSHHRGVDIVLDGKPNGGRGTSYTSFVNGTVIQAGPTTQGPGGNWVLVQADDGLYHAYMHNDAVLVQPGQRVQAGVTPIAVLGATGTEGFPHVHYEVRRNANGDPLDQMIDPRPYMRRGTPMAAPTSQPTNTGMGATPDIIELQNYTREVARSYGLPEETFYKQITQESGWQPDVIYGRRKSSAGAEGIAQIMRQYHPGVDPADPRASLQYAGKLMQNYLGQYGGDMRKALAAYNAGPGAVQFHGGVPPYAETQAYLQAILGQ